MPFKDWTFASADSLTVGTWLSPSEALVQDDVGSRNPSGIGAAIYEELYFHDRLGDDLPSGAIPEGFLVTIRAKKQVPAFTAETAYRFACGMSSAYAVVLGESGVARYTTEFLFDAWSTLTAGGPNDLFGLSGLSDVQANNANFGINLWRPSDPNDEGWPEDISEDRWVDFLGIRVFYSEPGSGGAIEALLKGERRHPGIGWAKNTGFDRGSR